MSNTCTIMIKVARIETRTNSKDKSTFNVMICVDDIIDITANGNPVEKSIEHSIPSAKTVQQLQSFIGKEYPFSTVKVPCAPKEITLRNGEKVTMTHEWKLQADAPVVISGPSAVEQGS